MKIIIDRVSNGYIVTCPSEDKEFDRDEVIVIEDIEYGNASYNSNDTHNDIKSFTNLVWTLHTLLSIPRDKHSEPEHWFTADCSCVLDKEYEDMYALKEEVVV